MRIHVLQHVPFEGIGSIEQWAYERGDVLTWTRFYESTELPTLNEVDFLLAMGGPMSVNDEAEFPWLCAEKNFIAAAIATGKPVLGICLGAQLIASSLGAQVYPGPEKEIGWHPIFGTETRSDTPFGAETRFTFPPEVTVFHWHGETFDLPPGAICLASTPTTPHQAFQVGRRVIGLQFHLETTPESAEALLLHCGDELAPGGDFIQSAAAMRSVSVEHFRAIHALMGEILDYLCNEKEGQGS